MSKSTLDLNLDYLAKPKQKLFHESEAKYRLYIGAWRAGKTYAGCWEAFKKSFLHEKNCGLIGRKDFTDLRDTTIKTFFDVCPQDFIKSYNKTEHHVVFVNGSEILFRELKDGTGLGSLNLGWFYIDEAEEVEESIFERLHGRLSLKNVGKPCGWLTSNPPNQDHWIYRQFEQDHKGDPDYFVIHATTYENKEHLPQGYIEDLEKMPASWRKKYLEGNYGFTPDGEPYYGGFKDFLHVWQFNWNPDKDLLVGWDFGYRHPACVITQLDNNDRWIILKEKLGTNVTIDVFADQVEAWINMYYPNAKLLHFGDPACIQKNDKSEFTSWQILANKGIHVLYKQSEYRQRKEIIEKRLGTIVGGKPMLMVDRSCKIVIDGFLGGYHYPVLKDGQQFVQKFEQPFKDGFYEHLMNALEYIAVNIFSSIKTKRPAKTSKRKRRVDNI